VYQIENSRQVLRSRAKQSRFKFGKPQVSQTVLMLGLTSMFTDISAEMVTTILPMYLVLNLHLSPLAFGAIDGINLCGAALVRLLSGAVADRSRRYKEIAVVGYPLSAISRLAMLLVGGAWGLARRRTWRLELAPLGKASVTMLWQAPAVFIGGEAICGRESHRRCWLPGESRVKGRRHQDNRATPSMCGPSMYANLLASQPVCRPRRP
jgi:hypothetical protein